MAREEDKHRGPEYVPPGPVTIAKSADLAAAREMISALCDRVRVIEQRLVVQDARIIVMEAQIASLMPAPRGIPKP